MKESILILIAFVFAVVPSLAQMADGTVLEDDGKAVKGACITNLCSGMRVYANKAGYFILNNTIKKDTIMVSHTGYQSRLLIYFGDTGINEIRLHKSHNHLSDVVVSSGIKATNVIYNIDFIISQVYLLQEWLLNTPVYFPNIMTNNISR